MKIKITHLIGLYLLIIIFSFNKSEASCLQVHQINLQPHDSIVVLFIHGSKPQKKFKKTEPAWFGGLHGGHVGIQIDTNLVVDFVKKGKLHVFGSRKKGDGVFILHSKKEFLTHFGNQEQANAITEISIPIDSNTKTSLQGIVTSYTIKSPYDYALFGMRCASATAELLTQSHLLPKRSRCRLKMSYYMPRRLRNRLLQLAVQNQWNVKRQKGISSRNWE